MASKEEKLDPETEGDPASFLLSNPKYHDCHLTVGIPDTGDVEKIGVSSTHLIAHSSVFRDMLADSQLADPSGTNTRIKDISPAKFKLMLRHVYGGKLPTMTPEEAAELALCADKYNIQRLVGKAAKRLKPTSAEDIFPALLCAAYIKCNDLELQVSKIVQEQTDKICQNPMFLQLDENCLLFIAKQSILNISELQLWNNFIRWGENQVKINPDKTLRECLNKVLQHVRLLTLTLNEIVDNVLPTKVLTPEEFMDLTLGVTNKQSLQSPTLCKIAEKRGVNLQETGENATSNEDSELEQKGISNGNEGKELKSFTFSTPPIYYYLNKTNEYRSYSLLTIKPTVNVEINTLTVKGIEMKSNNDQLFNSYELSCSIKIYKSSNGFLKQHDFVTVKGTAVPLEDIVLQVKKDNDKPLVLEANQTHHWQITIKPPLLVHTISSDYNGKNPCSTFSTAHFKITFEDPFHFIKIGYRA